MSELYSYKKLLCGQILRRGIPSQDVDDVAHDVFESALRNIKHLNKGEEVPFLLLNLRSVLSEAKRKWRTKKREGMQRCYEYDNGMFEQSVDCEELNRRYIQELLPRMSQRMHRAILDGAKQAGIEFGVSRQAIQKEFSAFKSAWYVSTPQQGYGQRWEGAL